MCMIVNVIDDFFDLQNLGVWKISFMFTCFGEILFFIRKLIVILIFFSLMNCFIS